MGKEVARLLGSDPLLHWEAWNWMKGWYWAAVDRAPPPSWFTLYRITAKRVDFYIYMPPPGGGILISVEPFPVDDSVPTEDNIEWVVIQLRNHHSGGTSGMRVKHLKGWLMEARKKEREEAASEQTTAAEGTTSVPNRMGTEGTEEIRGETPAEISNWERVVDLVQTAFEEKRLTG